MAVATRGYGLCNKVRHCCWRLTRMCTMMASLQSMTLQPYRHARVPVSQQQAVERGKIMRKARSRKKRDALLADLENRYLSLS